MQSIKDVVTKPHVAGVHVHKVGVEELNSSTL